MDLSMLQQFVPDLAGFFHLQPSTLLLYIGIVCTTANIIGRLIPDDKVGVLGTIRDVAKVVGVYAPNRITSGVTVNDIARSVVGSKVTQAEEVVAELASEPGALIPAVVGTVEDVREIIHDPIGKAAELARTRADEMLHDAR